MITQFKVFENDNYTEEYIFRCSTQWVGTEIIEELEYFTEKDFEDYQNHGRIWDEYYQKAIEEQGINFEFNDGILTISSQWVGTEEEIDAEGYDEDDYDNLMQLAADNQGLEFEIFENKQHPNYLIRKSANKYNL